MSDLELEQQSNIKFLVRLGKSDNEIKGLLVKVYGDNTMKEETMLKWIKCFSEGRETINSEEMPGKPIMSSSDDNGDIVSKNK